jgi:hypothetical protein
VSKRHRSLGLGLGLGLGLPESKSIQWYPRDIDHHYWKCVSGKYKQLHWLRGLEMGLRLEMGIGLNKTFLTIILELA